MVIYTPLKRVEEIEYCIFNAIVNTYAMDTVDYKFAKEKLLKYKNKGIDLAGKLSHDDKLKHTEQLEYQYYFHRDLLEDVKKNKEGTKLQTTLTEGQYLQKPKEIERDSFCPYLDGICEKCPC